MPTAKIALGQPLEVRNFGISGATFNPPAQQKPLRAADLRAFVLELRFWGGFPGAPALREVAGKRDQNQAIFSTISSGTGAYSFGSMEYAPRPWERPRTTEA